MEPTREVFWNISFGVIIDVLGILAAVFFFYVLYRRYKRWRLGRSDNRFSHLGKRIRAFLG